MKLLITGASGLLGANFVMQTHHTHEVVAVTHTHLIRLKGVKTKTADLSIEGGGSVISEASPDWVIHCAAGTDVDRCEGDPEYAFRMNRDMARTVARAAYGAGSKLIHISTDAVFDGLHSGNTEDDIPAPRNVYGQSKMEGEIAVLAEYPEALIVRTNFFGCNAQRKTSLSEFFWEKLSQGEKCKGFVDVKVKPILVDQLVTVLLNMMDLELTGIYHVLAQNCMSKYEFGLALAGEFDLDPDLIEPIPVDQLQLRAYRPHNLCLSTEKLLKDLNIEVPTIEVGIQQFRKNLDTGYADRLRAMAGGF
jgi:dTDP-4-dehydrorhamnose reductase